MLATFLEVLDTSVANVALPHIAGNLSAGADEATWVLTSYLVSNAIVLPMTGWLAVRFGRKQFLVTCIATFSLSSALCGAAPTLWVLIAARIFQGAAGGALQPISQAVLMESFPPAKRGVAMAIFAMGVVVAPIIGPTLGGWITDNYSWRWIFYINLPIGALAFYMCQIFIEDPPYLISARQSTTARIDYFGFSLMAIWLATLQIILDKGQQDDWFAAEWIRWAAGISFVSMVCFIIWEVRQKQPIVNLRVLKNRNFALGTALMTLVGVVLYSTITLQPLFLQNLMGYSAMDSRDSAESPRRRRDIGNIFRGQGDREIGQPNPYHLRIHYLGRGLLRTGRAEPADFNRQYNRTECHNGAGDGVIFVPLTTLTMGGLPNAQMGNAAGIFNLMRNLGGGIGISVVTTMLARNAQEHQTFIAAHFNPYNPQFQHYFQKLGSLFNQSGLPGYLDRKTFLALYDLAVQQATLLAYMDNFRLLAFVCLLCIPAVLVMKGLRGRSGPAGVH